MQIFDIVPGMEISGRVFPESIEGMDWVGYHGTSSAYSSRIESAGFERVKPLSDFDIDLVAALAARHGSDPDGSVAGFKTLGSISFSPSSALALAFAQPGKSGGQGVGFVRAQAAALCETHRESLSKDEIASLERIVAHIDGIRAATPVIYAVDLRGLELARFQTSTAAVHVYGEIPPVRLIAKALVPEGIDHAAIDQRALRDNIRAFYRSQSAHWICQLQQ